MQNEYYFIDKMKVILACLVVVLHSNPSYYVAIICNMAVPLFFSFSGFFYSRSNKSVTLFVRRIFVLYVFWLIVQWPLAFPMIKKSETIIDIVKQIIFSSSYPVSWYLIALIWNAILLTILKRLGLMVVLLVSGILYVMCVADLGWHEYFRCTILHSFNEMYKYVFKNIAWSFPQGFIFFAIGYYMKADRSKNFYILCSLCAMGLYFLENYYVEYHHLSKMAAALFSMPLLAYGLTGLCLKLCSSTSYFERGKLLREISTLIYLSHPFLMAIGFKLFGISGGIYRILFVLVTFIPFCFFYFRARKLKWLKWLKYAC